MPKAQSVDWDYIFRVAERLGVSYDARLKWKIRNSVPHKWRPSLVSQSRGRISWETFKKMDNQK